MPKLTTLSNGLRVATHKIPSIKTVSLGAFVKVGSRHETPEQNGITHNLEHLNFKATTTRSAEQLSYEIEKVGGDSNAFTSQEMTAYHATLLSDNVEVGIDIISDMLLNSTYPENEIDTERKVIIQEINRYQDNPSSIMWNGLYSTAYNDQSLGRPVLGPSTNIEKFTRDDFVQYMSDHYGSNRMVISAAGDVNHDEFVNYVEKYFGSLKSAKEDSFEKVTYKGGYFNFNKNFEQTNIALGFPSVGFKDKKHFATAEIFSIYFGGGMSSPLFQEIREKRGLVYSVACTNTSEEDTGVFTIYGGTTKEHLSEFIKVSRQEIEKNIDNIDMNHLERARNQYKVYISSTLERKGAVMQSMADDMLFYDKFRNIKEQLKKVDAVTVDELKDFAKNVLNTIPTLSIVGPVDDIDYYNLAR